MTKATLVKENIELGPAHSSEFSPLSSRWEARQLAGRHGAGGAARAASGSAGRRRKPRATLTVSHTSSWCHSLGTVGAIFIQSTTQ